MKQLLAIICAFSIFMTSSSFSGITAQNSSSESSFNYEEYIVYSYSTKTKNRRRTTLHTFYLVFHPKDSQVFSFRHGLNNYFDGTYSGSFDTEITIFFKGDKTPTVLEANKEKQLIQTLSGGDTKTYNLLPSTKDSSALRQLKEFLEEKQRVNAVKDLLRENYTVVTFGCYDQDGIADNGKEPIEWIVLEKGNRYSLLLSFYILDFQKPFNHKEQTEIKYYKRWGESYIRQWLNKSFLEAAFSEEEQACIQDTVLEIKYPRDSSPGAIKEETTTDKLFLLSKEEVVKYLPDSMAFGFCTDAFRWESPNTKSGFFKWLTINEKDITHWYCVDESFFGTIHVDCDCGIRPAIWVSNDFLEKR